MIGPNPIIAGPRGLLAGEVDRVWPIVIDIAEDIDRMHSQNPLGPTLSGGLGGAVLLNRYLYEAQASRVFEARAEQYLDTMLEHVARLPLTPLYGGTVGVAWLLAHLARLDGDEPEVGELDDILLAVLDQPWRGHYDVISGMVGIGVYGLERAPRPAGLSILERVIHRLSEMAIATPEGNRAYYTPREFIPPNQIEQYPGGYFNLGLAHGNPGCISFLASVLRFDVLPDVAGELIDELVPWLLARFRFADGRWVLPGVDGDERQPYPRLAWCYNELGAATSILAAAEARGREDWRRRGAEILRSTCRLPQEESGCQDASLCHGASGVAQMYLRSAKMLDDAVLTAEAHRWFEIAVQMRHPGRHCGGYAYFDAVHGPQSAVWDPRPGFLEGSAGIGLAFLAATHGSICSGWDRLLLLS